MKKQKKDLSKISLRKITLKSLANQEIMGGFATNSAAQTFKLLIASVLLSNCYKICVSNDNDCA